MHFYSKMTIDKVMHYKFICLETFDGLSIFRVLRHVLRKREFSFLFSVISFISNFNHRCLARTAF